MKTIRILAALGLLAAPAAAQSNAIDQLNVQMGILGSLGSLGRTGTFPNGMNGLAMSTTSCNNGQVDVNWYAPMNEDHPVISFMVVRESNGRMEQISNRSWVKHVFFALSSSQCTPCQNPTDGTRLGVGCSDTYGIGTNGSRFWLGPPNEINPWLGTWEATCSFFDSPNGETCDAQRTYQGSAANEVEHRVEVKDSDLNTPGSFYFQGYYMIAREPDANRIDNAAYRPFTPTWNGSAWGIATTGPQIFDSVLNAWSGAEVHSNRSNTDGRFYVGVRVTEPSPGTFHYEYAVHNRDNAGGGVTFRVPVAPGATVSNIGMNDPDDDPFNDWTGSVVSDEIRWTPLNTVLIDWNTIYNFYFDTDAAPVPGENVFIETGVGDVIDVPSTVPLDTFPVTYCSGKTNSLGCVPFIVFDGLPSATSPNPFTIQGSKVVPNQIGLLLYTLNGRGNLDFHNGKLCVKAPFTRLLPPKVAVDSGAFPCGGILKRDFNNRIQSGADPALIAGQEVNAQWIYRDPNIGDGFNDGLTNGIEFTIAP